MNVDLLVAASVELDRVVSGLPWDAWDKPTPCEVDVRELVEHLVEGNRFAVGVMNALAAADAWAAVTAEDGGLVDAVARSAAAQVEAFRSASADQVVHHPGGDISGEAFLRYRLVDVVVHAWDLLRAAGQDETLAPDVTEGLWELVEPHLTEMLAFGSYGGGPSGAVVSGAQARLLDAFGRRV